MITDCMKNHNYCYNFDVVAVLYQAKNMSRRFAESCFIQVYKYSMNKRNDTF